jgi:hypothetical protein
MKLEPLIISPGYVSHVTILYHVMITLMRLVADAISWRLASFPFSPLENTANLMIINVGR